MLRSALRHYLHKEPQISEQLLEHQRITDLADTQCDGRYKVLVDWAEHIVVEGRAEDVIDIRQCQRVLPVDI
jgi:hypothetical protein